MRRTKMQNFQNELQMLGMDHYQTGELISMDQGVDERIFGMGMGMRCGGMMCGGFHRCGGFHHCGGFRCGGFNCGGFRCFSCFNCFSCFSCFSCSNCWGGW